MPITTVLSVITDALSLLGVASSAVTVSANDADRGLSALNSLNEALGIERGAIVTVRIDVFALVANQQAYTYGSGGNWNAARPTDILQANIIVNNNPTLPVRYPLALLDDRQWSQVVSQLTPSTIPQALYNDGDYPLSVVSLWPVPTDSNNTIEIYSPDVNASVPQFTAISDTFNLAPGYHRMIKYNLAVELAPEFGREPSATVLRIAKESLAAVKSQNLRPPYASSDYTNMSSRRRTGFNIITGQ